jgi:hydroxymethylglutaryl-CoA synthase
MPGSDDGRPEPGRQDVENQDMDVNHPGVGLLRYGAYVPYYRLQRSAIGSFLSGGGGKGTRSVASYDEDTTSMGVEAARLTLSEVGSEVMPQRVLFSSAKPAYADKSNAAVIQAALLLDRSNLSLDMCGSVRSGVGAIVAAIESTVPALVVLSDIRVGLPGGADEKKGGDAAAGLLFGVPTADDPAIATVLSHAHVTEEFLDRWRLPGAETSHTWEERFAEQIYVTLAEEAYADALKRSGITTDDVDHLIVVGVHDRAAATFARSAGASDAAKVGDMVAEIGNAGTAHVGVVLADVLDRAGPDEVIVAVILADGASVIVLRTTGDLADRRMPVPVREQITHGNCDLSYASFLTWRGFLDREPPRRPDPPAPAAPPSFRSTRFKYGFEGSRCNACGEVHLPSVRVCTACGAVDDMDPVAMASVRAKVKTFTVDHLAYSLNPPIVAAVIDFEGGGRFSCQLTDIDPTAIAIGQSVEMTFRRPITASDVHNYFWKARPCR